MVILDGVFVASASAYLVYTYSSDRVELHHAKTCLQGFSTR